MSAQLQYRAAGNPPSTLPASAISNCFPGLEFDFRNIWRRIFEGIELHEADNYVTSAEAPFRYLKGRRLVRIAGNNVMKQSMGPRMPVDDGEQTVILSSAENPEAVTTMEWSNSLAEILHTHAGTTVACTFTKRKSELPVWVPEDPSDKSEIALQVVELKVRPLFAWSDEANDRLAVIDSIIAEPGELTASLCSPWQNDYRECACYYWAASRPDYVNVEPGSDGLTRGNHWLANDREPLEYVPDNGRDERLITYEDLFRDWQGKLKFIIEGKDAD